MCRQRSALSIFFLGFCFGPLSALQSLLNTDTCPLIDLAVYFIQCSFPEQRYTGDSYEYTGRPDYGATA
jgi:hypothetical protein